MTSRLFALAERLLDLMERGVVAHERIADAQEAMAVKATPRRPRAKQEDDAEPVSDLDRQKARQIARKMGLHVKDGGPR